MYLCYDDKNVRFIIWSVCCYIDQPAIPPRVPQLSTDDNPDDPFNDDIGPPPVPMSSNDDDDQDQDHEPKISVMTHAQNLIPAVFEETPVVDTQESFHAD